MFLSTRMAIGGSLVARALLSDRLRVRSSVAIGAHVLLSTNFRAGRQARDHQCRQRLRGLHPGQTADRGGGRQVTHGGRNSRWKAGKRLGTAKACTWAAGQAVGSGWPSAEMRRQLPTWPATSRASSMRGPPRHGCHLGRHRWRRSRRACAAARPPPIGGARDRRRRGRKPPVRGRACRLPAGVAVDRRRADPGDRRKYKSHDAGMAPTGAGPRHTGPGPRRDRCSHDRTSLAKAVERLGTARRERLAQPAPLRCWITDAEEGRVTPSSTAIECELVGGHIAKGQEVIVLPAAARRRSAHSRPCQPATAMSARGSQ